MDIHSLSIQADSLPQGMFDTSSWALGLKRLKGKEKKPHTLSLSELIFLHCPSVNEEVQHYGGSSS